MNQHFKASSLALLLFVPLLHTPETRADWRIEARGENILVGLGVVAGVAAVGCGIGALWSACTWSDADILKWAKDGLETIDLKYQQLNQHGGPLTARLQLFGNRNSASSSFWKTDIENITVNNRSLAPLHNTIIIMNDDRDQLKKYYRNLLDRNLHNHPRGKQICADIVKLLNDFENLSAVILSSPEYTSEEQALHKKLHQIKQERLDRERNEALEAQARAQRRQAEDRREAVERAERNEKQERKRRRRAEQEEAEARRELNRSQREQARAQCELARAQEKLADAQRRQQPTIIIIEEPANQPSAVPARAHDDAPRTEREHLRDLEVIFDY